METFQTCDISMMNHMVVDSPSVHRRSSFQRHQDPPEHIEDPEEGPLEENAGRRMIMLCY